MSYTNRENGAARLLIILWWVKGKHSAKPCQSTRRYGCFDEAINDFHGIPAAVSKDPRRSAIPMASLFSEVVLGHLTKE